MKEVDDDGNEIEKKEEKEKEKGEKKEKEEIVGSPYDNHALSSSTIKVCVDSKPTGYLYENL